MDKLAIKRNNDGKYTGYIPRCCFRCMDLIKDAGWAECGKGLNLPVNKLRCNSRTVFVR